MKDDDDMTKLFSLPKGKHFAEREPYHKSQESISNIQKMNRTGKNF